MLRKDSPQLKGELNALIARYPEGSPQRTQLLQKYFKSTKWAKEATSDEEIAKFERTVEFFRVELIAAEKIGRETVTYVSNMYNYYLAYQMLAEQREEREKAKEAVKEGAGK